MILDLIPGEFQNIPAKAGSALRFDQHSVSSIEHHSSNIKALTSNLYPEGETVSSLNNQPAIGTEYLAGKKIGLG
jgi:hypothetical protein